MVAGPDGVADALVLLSEGDPDAAREALHRAGDDRLAPLLASALDGDGALGGEVYVDPTAFQRFIDSPPNVALYAAVEDGLARWVAGEGSRVVDIGCGDGRVTKAVAPADAAVVELVEPAQAMLDVAAARFPEQRVDAWCTDAETWTTTVLVDTPRDRDVGWSTFALHNLPSESRHEVLTSTAAGVGRFAVVEFDVPRFSATHEHAAYCSARYRRGIEVHDDPLVVSGFLAPVLLGQFAPDAPRHTYEQPLETWANDLRRAGFVEVEVQTLHTDFWWAPAGMVTGRAPWAGTGRGST
ncbi:MAG: class I SAM-dependent methyltransferase [Ilumatobacteraceae bacterium]